ncbi:MAG: Chorismate pyruvate-lyase [Sodalis sp. Ffu]|nr:MAG: Chorismate pyruvate-lyase [Sodalis sp. Ffu]
MQNQITIALLDSICWLKDPVSWPNNTVHNWLMERKSMTRKLENYCTRISIQRYCEGFFSARALGAETNLLPTSKRLWLREVVLYGDEKPWLAARTLIPDQKITGSAKELMQLGDMPLGRWLFLNRPPPRDFIQSGRVGSLWARRYRLFPNDQPLLLTELFLPDSPLYTRSGDDPYKLKEEIVGSKFNPK